VDKLLDTKFPIPSPVPFATTLYTSPENEHLGHSLLDFYY